MQEGNLVFGRLGWLFQKVVLCGVCFELVSIKLFIHNKQTHTYILQLSIMLQFQEHFIQVSELD